MANEHYKHGNVETRELITEVFKHLPWLTSDEAVDVFNIVKYAQRAGFKDGVPWEQDARKIADYITHMKYGKYIDQRDEDFWKERIEVWSGTGEKVHEYAVE